MRNTLPLSSFPLHGLLSIQTYYVPFVSLTMFLILLYKTYNLPYTSGMSAQQGILLFIFILMMLLRTSQGISANKVFYFSYKFHLDLRLLQNGWIYIYDTDRNILLYLFHVHTILCHANLNHILCNTYHIEYIGTALWIFFLLAVSKLLKATVIRNINIIFSL